MSFTLVLISLYAWIACAQQQTSQSSKMVYSVMGLGYPLKNGNKLPWNVVYANRSSSEYTELFQLVCSYIQPLFEKFLSPVQCPTVTFVDYKAETLASFFYRIQMRDGTDPAKLRQDISEVFKVMRPSSSTTFRNAARMMISVYNESLVVAKDSQAPNLELAILGRVNITWDPKLSDPTSPLYAKWTKRVCEDVNTTLGDIIMTKDCPSIAFWSHQDSTNFDGYLSFTPSVYMNNPIYQTLANYMKSINMALIAQKPDIVCATRGVTVAFVPFIDNGGTTTTPGSASSLWTKQVTFLVSSAVLIQFVRNFMLNVVA